MIARPLHALATVLLVGLLVMLAPMYAQADTHQTVPSANFSFMSDLQNFLRVEDANRYADLTSSLVVSGGLHSTAAGLVGSPSALVAYLGGYYTTESGTITYPDASTCHVIAHKDTTANQGSYTRVAGTHYLINCASSIPPAIPDVNSVLLMTVTTSGGAITAVADLRPVGSLIGLHACRHATLDDALAELGTATTPLVVGCRLRVLANASIPATTTLIITNAGLICPDSGTTTTINAFIESASRQIFCAGSGTILIAGSRNLSVYPEWWGGNPNDVAINNIPLQAAVTAIASGGGTIRFACGSYHFSANIVIPSFISLRGVGMQCTKLINDGTTDLLTFTDSTTANKELRFGGVFDMSIQGNPTSGHGIVVENPYHFSVDLVRITDHGGIGITFDSHVNGSTYGQNMFVTRSFILHNLGGGIRLSGSGNLAVIDKSSINQNGFYGIYADRHKQLVVRDVEFADYYYESAIAGHQAIPIVINGGSAISLLNNSFEANAGNGATANTHIRTGWDGDVQTAALNDTQRLTISYNDFKSTSGAHEGALNHITLDRAQGVEIVENFFEKEVGYGYTVNGVSLGADMLTNGGLLFRSNKWDTLDAKLTGVSRPFLFDDVYFDSASLSATVARGARCTAYTQIMQWQRYDTDTYDTIQVLCDGSLVRGLGATAPTVKFLIGAGSPEGVITAGVGSIYQRTNGGANTSIYVKESGTGNTGWVAK